MSLVRLSFELGMAVSDYNCGITNDYEQIISTTFMYLDKVKESNLENDELVECYAIIGQMWAAVIDRSSTAASTTEPASEYKETELPEKKVETVIPPSLPASLPAALPAAKEPPKEAVKEASKEPAKEPAKEAVKESKEPVKESKEPVKESKEPAKASKEASKDASKGSKDQTPK